MQDKNLVKNWLKQKNKKRYLQKKYNLNMNAK